MFSPVLTSHLSGRFFSSDTMLREGVPPNMTISVVLGLAATEIKARMGITNFNKFIRLIILHSSPLEYCHNRFLHLNCHRSLDSLHGSGEDPLLPRSMPPVPVLTQAKPYRE